MPRVLLFSSNACLVQPLSQNVYVTAGPVMRPHTVTRIPLARRPSPAISLRCDLHLQISWLVIQTNHSGRDPCRLRQASSCNLPPSVCSVDQYVEFMASTPLGLPTCAPCLFAKISSRTVGMGTFCPGHGPIARQRKVLCYRQRHSRCLCAFSDRQLSQSACRSLCIRKHVDEVATGRGFACAPSDCGPA